MFNSVALDVFIGLIFIYLLYSLLATVVQELIASYMGLRAKQLEKAIARMLNDEVLQVKDVNLFYRLWTQFKRIIKIDSVPYLDKDLSQAFYKHPLIKYLGSDKSSGKPAYLSGQNFSKVMVDLLRGDEIPPNENIVALIHNSLTERKTRQGEASINPETLSYLKSLWTDAKFDVEKFGKLLEQWFDDTMERATGWYKRQTQIILLVIGLILATVFNVDTFVIVKKLSVDQNARNNLVAMANAYIENKNTSFDDTKTKDSTSNSNRLDSLLTVKKQLDEDILKANNLLGISGWPPDNVKITKDEKTKKITFSFPIDIKAAGLDLDKVKLIEFNFFEKIWYLIKLLYYHLFGFLVTALAISLGAPFWFDLLNKLMQLRSSKKDTPNNPNNPNTNTQPITLNLNTPTSEEAVG